MKTTRNKNPDNNTYGTQTKLLIDKYCKIGYLSLVHYYRLFTKRKGQLNQLINNADRMQHIPQTMALLQYA